MLADLGRPPVAIEDIRAYVGRGIPNLVKRVLAGKLEAADDPAPPPEDALTTFKKHYAEVNGRAARPFPGVMEGLMALKAMGLPLGVITNKARRLHRPHCLSAPAWRRSWTSSWPATSCRSPSPTRCRWSGPAAGSASRPPTRC